MLKMKYKTEVAYKVESQRPPRDSRAGLRYCKKDFRIHQNSEVYDRPTGGNRPEDLVSQGMNSLARRRGAWGASSSMAHMVVCILRLTVWAGAA